MKSVKEPSVLEKIKQEIIAQEEGVTDVLELIFESIKIDKFTPEVAKLFLKYDKLVSVEFSECDIKSLDGFPLIPGLIKLSLESNQLSNDSVEHIAKNFKELQFLSLTANNIKSLEYEAVKHLSQLTQLVQLDLQDNPVALVEEYRQTLFEVCKSLEILDNQDREGNEVNYSDDDEEEDEENDKEDGDFGDDDEEDEEDEDDDDDEDDLEPEPKKKKRG